MMLRCAETDELLGPFAVDALESEDRSLVLEHLAECRRHDADLDAYRDVASLLPLAIEEEAPPPDLRASVLASFAATLNGRPSLEEESQARRSILNNFRLPAFAYALAAALLVLAGGLTAWNLSLQDDESIISRSVEQDGLQLRVLYLPGERLAVIRLDMPALAPDRTYQAWGITDTGPFSLGVLQNRGSFVVEADLSRANAIAISVEPAGGSSLPTTTPVVVLEI
jgi:anti-sigma-K factor RskA